MNLDFYNFKMNILTLLLYGYAMFHGVVSYIVGGSIRVLQGFLIIGIIFLATQIYVKLQEDRDG
jgi:hypothetical protein